ncbi:MAG: energy transducer TonB [Rhizorhabdus sp.]|jgi:hypothetical protein
MQIRTMMAIPLLAGLAGTAAAADPVPLAPSSKWQMDYAPSECRLLRSFGEGKDRTTLQLGRLDVTDAIEMALAGPHVPATDRELPVTVSTATVTQVPGIHARGFAAGRGTPGTLRFRPDVDLPVALRGDVAAGRPTRLGIRFVRGYAVQLDLGGMQGPLAALDRCMDDLVTAWGLDPAEQRQRKSEPEPLTDPIRWFKPDDYPASLNRSGVGAIVVIRLVVAVDGTVRDCAVAKAGGDTAFEDLTCRLATTRARFRPAIGAAGRPIASVWIRRIAWNPAAPLVGAAD